MKRGNGGLPVGHKDFEQAGRLFAHGSCAIVYNTPPPPTEKHIPVL
ncbi:MAG: hypothetical protein LBK66_13975 [Spirochaetaceae bacterium]|nr:hypothetical protein [Spirochaetaceae bacterium]